MNFDHDAPQRGAPIDGRTAFTEAMRQVAQHALHTRARELCIVDPNFTTWPLDDGPWLDALTRWSRLPERQLLIVATRFEDVVQRCPRFTEWRGIYAHAVQAYATDVEPSQVPTLLLAGESSLMLVDRLRWRGHYLSDDKEVADWREVVDVLLQRSEPGFAANLLGL